jgi:ribosomal protein S18 acetylase RimI-like enzyme
MWSYVPLCFDIVDNIILNYIIIFRLNMIRQANIKDSSRLAEIQVFAWRHAYKDFMSIEYLFKEFTVKDREKIFNENLSQDNNNVKTFVFEDNNIIKGYMTIGDCRDNDKTNETYEIWSIYVDPLFQRQKIGTELIKYCINEALNMNKKEITLFVFEQNNKSIEFYKRMGFTFDGTINYIEYFNVNEIRLSYKI